MEIRLVKKTGVPHAEIEAHQQIQKEFSAAPFSKSWRGYLLEQLGKRNLAESLMATLEVRRHRPVLLAPGQAHDVGQALPDPRWRVIPNVIVENDL